MPRGPRIAPGGMVFHVLNRGNDRRTIFEDGGDNDALLLLFRRTQELEPMRVLAYMRAAGRRKVSGFESGIGE
jgi:hypothetical protein